jgi:DNA modification methylase
VAKGATVTKHPARFTDRVLEVIVDVCVDLLAPGSRVLDPFAGTGRVHVLPFDTTGVELEPEWATMQRRTLVGNALALPFRTGAFDAVVTSPCYGNRMADHHNARDPSRRRSYTHDLGRMLHEDNAGAMQWGERYQAFHRCAWREVTRVCNNTCAVFVLNVSDHIRKGERARVVGFHMETLWQLGWVCIDVVPIATPRMRYGENAKARVDGEVVAVFTR